MSKTRLLIAALAIVASGTAIAEEKRRQLDAHVHGRGTLSIAIEGKRVSLELEAPAHDIVGFEHDATTPEQQSAVEEATALLSEGKELFKPPQAAQCTLDEAKVEWERGEAEDDHDEKAEAEHEHDEAEVSHSAFHATYAMTCAEPASLTALEATYFKAFAGAAALDVTVVAPKGQSTFELTRDKPRLDLSGLL